ncbi:hypothetical protein D1BOALGB6SA_10336 [Olavius sp. associated proteobacterium Delta 1]|nr:hypothetical protein D1BOALGB6SA_10336 [Olavius sp. associated proteobacterium Delta 1]
MEDEICPHCGEIITEKDRLDYWDKEFQKTQKRLKGINASEGTDSYPSKSQQAH